MEDGMEQEIKVSKLDSSIRALKEAVITLDTTSRSDTEELIKIIKRPGWTTPAELLLVIDLVESMNAQVMNVNRQFGVVMSASREIAGEKVVR
jgi:uncharacterized protein with von Willebrand factor type A (vWA) domain